MSDKPVKFYSDHKAHKNAEKLIEKNIPSESLPTAQAKGYGLPAEVVLKKPQKTSIFKKLFWPTFSTFVIFAAGYEAYDFIAYLYDKHWLLGGLVGLVGATALVSGVFALYKGWLARRRFKRRQTQKESFQAILTTNSYGQAADLLDEVSTEISGYAHIEQLQKDYNNRKQQVHNDQELIQIYSSTILKGLDSAAIEVITKHSSEAAAMVALSPLAVVDMTLVAWRSSKMLEQLSQLYGCPQTALGRFEMTKRVFKNMMLAGASELVADAGVELLGKGLTATISTKAAQGIGVGLLVARMGLQTMHLCRPIPYDRENKPKLSQVRKSVVNKVIGLIKSASTAKSAKHASDKELQQEVAKQTLNDNDDI